jgi:hypothetical protein
MRRKYDVWFEDRMLRRIFVPKRAEVTRGCRKLHSE